MLCLGFPPAVQCAGGGAARMGWASAAIERLRRGEVVVVEPLDDRALHVGDVVRVRVRERESLHLIKAIQADRYLIGNHRGGVNGWVGRQAVAGIATEIASGR